MRQYMMARRRYGTMGFSSLALVTADDPRHAALHATALNATRMLADYMEAQQVPQRVRRAVRGSLVHTWWRRSNLTASQQLAALSRPLAEDISTQITASVVDQQIY